MRYHLKPVKKATIKRQEKTSVGENVEKREPSCSIGGTINRCSLKTSMIVPQKN